MKIIEYKFNGKPENDSGIYVNMARMAIFSRASRDEGITYLERALDINPENEEAHALLKKIS